MHTLYASNILFLSIYPGETLTYVQKNKYKNYIIVCHTQKTKPK